MLAWIYWDPSSEFLIIPFFNLPITWYGLLFATGFWIGFHIFTYMFKKFLISERKEIKNANLVATAFAEKLLLYIIIATIVGARLGHIFFYEHPMEYLTNPLSILKTWEGGLASHGAIFAIVISLALFSRQIKKEWPEFTFWRLIDYIAVPTMLVCAMIRVGNFFNQEILGINTDKPWGIIFGHPADGSEVVPRHPAQLYEAAFYFGVFLLLFFLWYRKGRSLLPGKIAGISFVVSFLFRFLIEFIKTEQSTWFNETGQFLLMGQILSLPMIALGFYMLLRKVKLKV